MSTHKTTIELDLEVEYEAIEDGVEIARYFIEFQGQRIFGQTKFLPPDEIARIRAEIIESVKKQQATNEAEGLIARFEENESRKDL